jgi:hypothetical protein
MKKVMLITLILTFVSVSVAQDPGWFDFANCDCE